MYAMAAQENDTTNDDGGNDSIISNDSLNGPN